MQVSVGSKRPHQTFVRKVFEKLSAFVRKANKVYEKDKTMPT